VKLGGGARYEGGFPLGEEIFRVYATQRAANAMPSRG